MMNPIYSLQTVLAVQLKTGWLQVTYDFGLLMGILGGESYRSTYMEHMCDMDSWYRVSPFYRSTRVHGNMWVYIIWLLGACGMQLLI